MLLGKYKQIANSFYSLSPLQNENFYQGNHDHIGNATAQIEYTQVSEKWFDFLSKSLFGHISKEKLFKRILPDFNYVINIRTANGSTHVMSILVIDTVQLCGLNRSSRGQTRFEGILDDADSRAQLKMIEDTLEKLSKTDVPYVIVAGHYPVWSISAHGPTPCMIEKIRPILQKYSVTAYFCGHDHNLQ
jgi:tartrate-resistant acid phosphatase type 5